MKSQVCSQQMVTIGLVLSFLVGCASVPTPLPPTATLIPPTLTTTNTSTPVPPSPTVTTPTPIPPTSTPTPTATPTPTLVPMTAFMKGVAYTSWRRGEYSSRQSDTTLSQVIKPMGVNWITLLVTCYQEKITSTQIQCKIESSTPTDDDLAYAIQYAHSLGIRVMLKPHIDLTNDPSHWRGQIDFGGDEAGWKAWFDSYTNFITHYATLAQKTGADYFAVGTELPSPSRRADQWRAVVKAVRAVFSGPLIYAANHGEEVDVSWWDAVDAIGVDAYYPLTQSNQPTVADLKAAWAPIVSRLGQLSKKWNRPIVFTEIGYRSIDGANRAPYDFQMSGGIDLKEQADCYEAVFESFAGQDWWHGAFWWNWTTNPAQGGPFDNDYTANNKPAEDILRKNYGAPLRPTPTPTPALVVDEKNQLVIYHDALGTGWQNWSWDSTVDLAFRDIKQSGDAAIKVSLKPWGALSLHNRGVDTSPYRWLEFYINVGDNTQRRLAVYFNDKSDAELPQKIEVANPLYIDGGKLLSNQWQRVRIQLADMGASQITIVRVNIKDNSGAGQKDFFVDEIRLIGALPSP